VLSKSISIPIKDGVDIPKIGTHIKIIKDENLYGEGALHVSMKGQTGTVYAYEYKPDAKYIHWYNCRLVIDLDNKSLFQSWRGFIDQVEATHAK